jgi:AraC family transcriptional regulator
MPRRHTIKNRVGLDLYSIQVYASTFDFHLFNESTPFERWATVAVADFNVVPDGMETFSLPGGLYAVFDYKGTPETFSATAQYLFGTWLPQSGYHLDNRPHFEILGSKYKHNDPDSEEEIWIPVSKKG